MLKTVRVDSLKLGDEVYYEGKKGKLIKNEKSSYSYCRILFDDFTYSEVILYPSSSVKINIRRKISEIKPGETFYLNGYTYIRGKEIEGFVNICWSCVSNKKIVLYLSALED